MQADVILLLICILFKFWFMDNIFKIQTTAWHDGMVALDYWLHKFVHLRSIFLVYNALSLSPYSTMHHVQRYVTWYLLWNLNVWFSWYFSCWAMKKFIQTFFLFKTRPFVIFFGGFELKASKWQHSQSYSIATTCIFTLSVFLFHFFFSTYSY